MLTSVEEKTGLDFKPEAGDEAWLPVEDFLDKPVAKEVLLDKVKWGKNVFSPFFQQLTRKMPPRKNFIKENFFLTIPE